MNPLFFILFFIINLTASIGYSALIYRNNWLKAILSAPAIFFIIVSLTTAYLSFLGLPIKLFALSIELIYLLLGFLLLAKFLLGTKVNQNNQTASWLYITLIFATFVVFITLFSFLNYKVFNFYNDSTTYVIHSEYLLNHDFFDSTNLREEPWIEDMLLYQKIQARMGAQFFLGFINSLTPGNNSFITYPYVFAFSQFATLFCISLLASKISTKKQFLITTLISYLLAINLNISVSLQGFFPQSFGIMLLLLVLSIMINGKAQTKFEFTEISLLTFAIGSLVLTYQEIVPFFLIGTVLLVSYQYFLKVYSLRNIFQIGTAFLLAVILFPISSLMLISGIMHLSQAVVGWNEKISSIEYLLLLTGHNIYSTSSSFIKRLLLLPGVIATLLAIPWLFIVGLKYSVKARLLFTIGIPFILVAGAYRFLTANPFDGTVGHSWNLYKIMQWTYWMPSLIIAIGFYEQAKRANSSKVLLFSITLLIILTPALIFNIRNIIYHQPLATRTIVGTDEPITDYLEITSDETLRQSANIWSFRAHPNIGYMILGLMQNNSHRISLNPNQSTLNLNGEEPNQPSLKLNYKQWVFHRNARLASNYVINRLAGFDIYPEGTLITLFTNGFSDTSVNSKNSFFTLEETTGTLMLYIPEEKIGELRLETRSTTSGILVINNQRLGLSESISIKKQGNDPIVISNLKTGFYKINISWIPSEEKHTHLIFENSQLIDK